MHTDEIILANRIDQTLDLVEVGSIYYHYKDINQKKPYMIVSVALKEETEEPMIIYQAQYGKGLIWARPLTSWLEEVEHQGKSLPRFINSCSKKGSGAV